MPRLMLVDDEINILNALRRALARSLPPGTTVEAFTDPRAALARAGELAFDVVLADYRMPGMNGVELLDAFRQRCPDTVRLMLSGESDFAVILDAVNSAQIFHYIRKPWSFEELGEVIGKALAQRAVNLRLRDEEGADALTGLPTRVAFRAQLAQQAGAAAGMAVAIAGLDDFRQINATHGSAAGDALLCQLARHIEAAAGPGACVARVGADEFAVCLAGASEASAIGLAKALRQATAIALPDGLSASASVGLAFQVQPSANAGPDLLRKAEDALHFAKQNARGTWQAHGPDIEAWSAVQARQHEQAQHCLATLTAREREVMDLMVAGKPNKLIAHELGISARTVENHRARVMEKARVSSLSELVQLVMRHHS